MIARVAQRKRTDCGVACVAMLAGVPYEKARAEFGRVHRTTTDECIRALRRLGVKVKKEWRGADDIGALTMPALVKANKKRKHWHWVVYDPATRQMIDPANCKAIVPLAYLAVSPK